MSRRDRYRPPAALAAMVEGMRRDPVHALALAWVQRHLGQSAPTSAARAPVASAVDALRVSTGTGASELQMAVALADAGFEVRVGQDGALVANVRAEALAGIVRGASAFIVQGPAPAH